MTLRRVSMVAIGSIAVLVGAAALTIGVRRNIGGNQPESPGGVIADTSNIAKISVIHTGCFGSCPAYAVTLNADGTALYEGYEYAPRIGTFSGKFYDWRRAVAAVGRANFFGMQDDYDYPITDSETIYTIVTRKNGMKKQIRDYAGRGPQELWELETLIDGAVANVDWKLIDPKVPTRRLPSK